MFTQNDINSIISNYNDNYCSLNELSKNFNCTTQTIKKILISNNIHIRSRFEQTKYTNMKRKKTCDDNYFSVIDNYDKAWLLGFLMVEGTIRKDRNSIKIGLSAIDKKILQEIKNNLHIQREILEYQTNNGFDVVQLEWTSKQQKEDLKKYGIVHNKTYLKNHLPSFDNDNYILAYILGYFDGNGTISVSKDGYLRFRLCSYTKTILEDIIKFLQLKYNIKYSLYKNKNVYELSISTFYANKIFNDMYTLNTIHLERKYQKYLEYKTHETLTSNCG